MLKFSQVNDYLVSYNGSLKYRIFNRYDLLEESYKIWVKIGVETFHGFTSQKDAIKFCNEYEKALTE